MGRYIMNYFDVLASDIVSSVSFVTFAENCLILTDSLSSVRALLFRKITHQTHPLMHEC
jgi:hypothetical protein